MAPPTPQRSKGSASRGRTVQASGSHHDRRASWPVTTTCWRSSASRSGRSSMFGMRSAATVSPFVPPSLRVATTRSGSICACDTFPLSTSARSSEYGTERGSGAPAVLRSTQCAVSNETSSRSSQPTVRVLGDLRSDIAAPPKAPGGPASPLRRRGALALRQAQDLHDHAFLARATQKTRGSLDGAEDARSSSSRRACRASRRTRARGSSGTRTCSFAGGSNVPCSSASSSSTSPAGSS